MKISFTIRSTPDLIRIRSSQLGEAVSQALEDNTGFSNTYRRKYRISLANLINRRSFTSRTRLLAFKTVIAAIQEVKLTEIISEKLAKIRSELDHLLLQYPPKEIGNQKALCSENQ